MGKDATSIAYVITNESYDRIYQHDIGGENYYHKKVSAYFNRFVAEEDALITAVGTQFTKAGMEYAVAIAVNDIEMYTQKGNSKYGGYETIKLNSLIQVKKGDKFDIAFVIKCILLVIPEFLSNPEKAMQVLITERLFKTLKVLRK